MVVGTGREVQPRAPRVLRGSRGARPRHWQSPDSPGETARLPSWEGDGDGAARETPRRDGKTARGSRGLRGTPETKWWAGMEVALGGIRGGITLEHPTPGWDWPPANPVPGEALVCRADAGCSMPSSIFSKTLRLF